MCFIVAKDFNKQGCIAMQMGGGKRGEYELYVFADSADEFKNMTLKL